MVEVRRGISGETADLRYLQKRSLSAFTSSASAMMRCSWSLVMNAGFSEAAPSSSFEAARPSAAFSV